MGNRDLVTEIHYASQGDSSSIEYLKNLSQDEWEADDWALGNVMADGACDDFFDGFCRVFIIAGPHGVNTLTTYLESTFGPSVSSAIRVIQKIGGEEMAWAVPILDRQTANEDLPVYVRNNAAKAAAMLDGRPEPEPIVDRKIPVDVGELRSALDAFSDADFEQKGRIADCAKALDHEADAICAEFLDQWFRDQLPGYEFQYTLTGCPPFERALIAILDGRTTHFADALTQAASVFSGRSDLEPYFEQLLESETDEALVPKIAWTLANITGESWLDAINAKNGQSRQFARDAVKTMNEKYLRRQAMVLLDTIASYSGLYGWGAETDVLLDALDRIENVDEILIARFQTPPDDRYWRPESFYRQEYLVETLNKISSVSPNSEWAARVLIGLKQ